MKKISGLLLVVLFCFASGKGFAQQTKIDSIFAKGDTTAILDSLLEGFDAFLDSLSKPKSFLSVTLGVGNRTFSVRNNSLNTQSTDTRLSFTPGISYYHKSGLGINATGFLSMFDDKLNLYQYALTPSYDYTGERTSAGISYTRYFDKDTVIRNVSPYDNDFYGYFTYQRGSWRYGLAAGFATGAFDDVIRYKDSVLRFNPLTQRIEWLTYQVEQQSKNTIKDYSLSVSVRKEFEWEKIFTKRDMLTLAVSAYLVSGKSIINSNTSQQLVTRRNIILSRFKRTYDSENGNDFQLQSAAVSVSLFYSVGRFNLQPVFFMDYYFPETDKRFNQVFSVVAGINF